MKPPILAVYYVLGYPNLATSIQYMLAAVQAGANVVEIGIPFSDPIADGPIIQEANRIALENGVKLDDAWSVAQQIAELGAYAYIMTYSNLIMQYGYEKFVREAQRRKISGIILPDLPPEYLPESLYGINPVYLVSPNTDPERRKILCQKSQGFIYLQARLGTTGGISGYDERVSYHLNYLKETRPSLPKLVGFGINSISQTHQLIAMGADGVILGSTLVQAIQRGENPTHIVQSFISILN